MIRPTQQLAWTTGVPLSVAIAEVFFPQFFPASLAVVGIVLIVAVVDLVRLPKARGISVIRETPTTMPVGIQRAVHLRLLNKQPRPLSITVSDFYPGLLRAIGLPSPMLEVLPNRVMLFTYQLLPNSRGSFEFGIPQLALASPWRFWQRLVRVGHSTSIRVYPDYAQVLKSALLAAQQRLDMMGILKRRRRGEGTEFQQLREFRTGDRLSQVNWKATAKLGTLISNEFQEERDQQIVVLIDCSYRMRSQDDELSHFDHTLNAVILLSYFATKQGDAIGLMTFSGDQQRFVAPAKGTHVIPKLLDTLFDLQPSNDSPDYQVMCRQLFKFVKKRSLVVLVTTIRDDVAAELKSVVRTLSARHLVIVVNLREAILTEIQNRPIRNMDDALTWLGAQEFSLCTRRAVDALRTGSVEVLDTSAKDLPIALANRYLALKNSGRL